MYYLVSQFKPNFDLDHGSVTAEFDLTAESLFKPKLTLRIPSLPKFLKKVVNKFNSLWKGITKRFRKYHVKREINVLS